MCWTPIQFQKYHHIRVEDLKREVRESVSFHLLTFLDLVGTMICRRACATSQRLTDPISSGRTMKMQPKLEGDVERRRRLEWTQALHAIGTTKYQLTHSVSC